MAETVLLWVLVAVLLLVGLAGLVLPALPGPPLLFGGLLLAAWIEDFAYVGTGSFSNSEELGAWRFLEPPHRQKGETGGHDSSPDFRMTAKISRNCSR